jgi:hypothetical protein
MKTSISKFAAMLAIMLLNCFTFQAYAGTTEMPGASRFYPFVGNWQGQGELAQPGQEPVKLDLKLECEKVASGWAVSCAMQASNKEMTIMESDLMGVDPVTGQAHWFAVTNQGETHDHLAKWQGINVMQAHYVWSQDGMQMREDISFLFQDEHTASFRSVVTADGKQAGAFSGSLKR